LVAKLQLKSPCRVLSSVLVSSKTQVSTLGFIQQNTTPVLLLVQLRLDRPEEEISLFSQQNFLIFK